MPTHRIYGTVKVAGQPADRMLDIVSVSAWGSAGPAAAVVASVTSDMVTGAWEAELESAEPVYVLARPLPPYPPLVLGPYKPVPL